jgi:phosphatidylethanolamine N-methyltransferase
MAIDGPIEIYGEFHGSGLIDAKHTHCIRSVDKPETLDFSSVRTCLKRIVPLCLDSDPSLIPLSCQSPHERQDVVDDDTRDPDDFRLWSESQAKRICLVIEQSFGVEYRPEVIVADANLTALANRILVSSNVLDS